MAAFNSIAVRPLVSFGQLADCTMHHFCVCHINDTLLCNLV